MLEQSLMRHQFRDLLEKNLDAVKMYESAIEHNRQTICPDKLNPLLADKKRHVELTERLLEIVG